MMRERLIVVWALLFFLLFSAVPGHSAAQEKKQIYTLKESIAEAMAKNWFLKAKKAKVDQATDAKKQARAEFLPKLRTDYGYTRQNEPRTFKSALTPDQEIAVSSEDNYQWRTIVRQPIFTGFALTSSFKLAKLGVDQSKMEVELNKLDLALKVKEAYFKILIANKGVDVARKEVESLESNVEVARHFYEAGTIPVNDLLKAEVELANAQQNLVKARNTSRLSRAAFNTVLSRPINEPVEVEDILTYEPETGDVERHMSNALENRPEIKILDINILQAKQEIRLAKSKNYPDIALTYEYIKEGDKARVSGSPFHDASRWQAMAVASWTFWEWGKTYYTIREKKGYERELTQTKMSVGDEIRFEVKEAVLALKEAEKNVPTTTKAVEQAEENLRVNEERYIAQLTTITEVLDAQALLTRARVNYYEALYNHNLAKARLRRATGEY